MNTLITVFIDLFVLLCAFIIIKRSVKIGAAKTLIQIAGIITAFVLISTTTNVLSETIYNNFVKEKVVLEISKTVNSTEKDYKTAIKSSTPDYIIKCADYLGIDINKELDSTYEQNNEKISENIETKIFKPIFVTFIKLVLFVLLILISILLIKLLSKLTLVINKIPIIRTANKGLGFIFGVLKAFILLIFVCSIIMYIDKNFNFNINIKLFENTIIFKYLCNLNFLF